MWVVTFYNGFVICWGFVSHHFDLVHSSCNWICNSRYRCTMLVFLVFSLSLSTTYFISYLIINIRSWQWKKNVFAELMVWCSISGCEKKSQSFKFNLIYLFVHIMATVDIYFLFGIRFWFTYSRNKKIDIDSRVTLSQSKHKISSLIQYLKQLKTKINSRWKKKLCKTFSMLYIWNLSSVFCILPWHSPAHRNSYMISIHFWKLWRVDGGSFSIYWIIQLRTIVKFTFGLCNSSLFTVMIKASSELIFFGKNRYFYFFFFFVVVTNES